MIFDGPITMIDYSRSLSERKATRKFCGPYMWTPQEATKREGFGFYQSSDKRYMRMDSSGSIVDMRIEHANKCFDDINNAYNRKSRIDGYYCDELGDQTMQPIVCTLPNKRGFLAGWTMGEGMCASLSTHIWKDRNDAALAAHDEAEKCAEQEQEYQQFNQDCEDVAL